MKNLIKFATFVSALLISNVALAQGHVHHTFHHHHDMHIIPQYAPIEWVSIHSEGFRHAQNQSGTVTLHNHVLIVCER